LIAAYVFAAPQAAPVVRAMAPTLLVAAASIAATALLTRELDFRSIQLATLGSYVVGYLLVGVGAAMAGLGVWSLVLAWHVQTIGACGYLVWRSPRRLWPSQPFQRLALDRYANVVFATHLTNWVIDNGPHVVVGRWLGASMLGLYTVANNLVKVPADHLARNVQHVLHALASRTQDDDAKLRRAYLTVVAGIGVVAFPTFVFVATMADAVVDLLLGAKWTAAAPVLVPLSIAMALHAVEAMAGPTLSGRGEPGVELRVKLGTFVLTLPMLLITARWSLQAVAWGVAAVFLLRWLWMHGATARRLHITRAQFGGAIGGPLLLGALAWLVPMAVTAALELADVDLAAGWLIALAAVPTAAFIVAVTLAAPSAVLGPQLLALLDGVLGKRPAWAARPGLRRLAMNAARASYQLAVEPSPGKADSSWTRQPKTSY
jgi:PST family polysaccharide transporter